MIRQLITDVTQTALRKFRLQKNEIALHKGYLFPIERGGNNLQTIWKDGFNQCENILRVRRIFRKEVIRIPRGSFSVFR